MVSRGFPTERRGIPQFTEGRRWCPGNFPLTEVSSWEILRAEGSFRQIPHQLKGASWDILRTEGCVPGIAA